MKKRVKATAKHDANVSMFVDPNALSLLRVVILGGTVIEREVIEDRTLTGPLAEILGDRAVTVRLEDDSLYMSSLHSKDFILEVIG